MGAYLPGASTLDLAGINVQTLDPAKGGGALCSYGPGPGWSVFLPVLEGLESAGTFKH